MIETFIIDGVEYGYGLPNIDDIDGTPVDESKIDPDGWRIYSDIINEATVRYIFKYAREHPDSDLSYARTEEMWYLNRDLISERGRGLKGYDVAFYEEFPKHVPDEIM